MATRAQLLAWHHAVEAYRIGQWDTALDHFGLAGPYAKIAFNSGMVFVQLRDWTTALALFTESTRLDPYFLAGYLQCGYAAFVLQDYERSASFLTDALDGRRAANLPPPAVASAAATASAMASTTTLLMPMSSIVDVVDYAQLGLAYRLYRADLLWNRAMCHLALGAHEAYLCDIRAAGEAALTGRQHQVTEDALCNLFDHPVTFFHVPHDAVFELHARKLQSLMYYPGRDDAQTLRWLPQAPRPPPIAEDGVAAAMPMSRKGGPRGPGPRNCPPQPKRDASHVLNNGSTKSYSVRSGQQAWPESTAWTGEAIHHAQFTLDSGDDSTAEDEAESLRLHWASAPAAAAAAAAASAPISHHAVARPLKSAMYDGHRGAPVAAPHPVLPIPLSGSRQGWGSEPETARSGQPTSGIEVTVPPRRGSASLGHWSMAPMQPIYEHPVACLPAAVQPPNAWLPPDSPSHARPRKPRPSLPPVPPQQQQRQQRSLPSPPQLPSSAPSSVPHAPSLATRWQNTAQRSAPVRTVATETVATATAPITASGTQKRPVSPLGHVLRTVIRETDEGVQSSRAPPPFNDMFTADVVPARSAGHHRPQRSPGANPIPQQGPGSMVITPRSSSRGYQSYRLRPISLDGPHWLRQPKRKPGVGEAFSALSAALQPGQKQGQRGRGPGLVTMLPRHHVSPSAHATLLPSPPATADGNDAAWLDSSDHTYDAYALDLAARDPPAQTLFVVQGHLHPAAGWIGPRSASLAPAERRGAVARMDSPGVASPTAAMALPSIATPTATSPPQHPQRSARRGAPRLPVHIWLTHADAERLSPATMQRPMASRPLASAAQSSSLRRSGPGVGANGPASVGSRLVLAVPEDTPLAAFRGALASQFGLMLDPCDRGPLVDDVVDSAWTIWVDVGNDTGAHASAEALSLQQSHRWRRLESVETRLPDRHHNSSQDDEMGERRADGGHDAIIGWRQMLSHVASGRMARLVLWIRPRDATAAGTDTNDAYAPPLARVATQRSAMTEMSLTRPFRHDPALMVDADSPPRLPRALAAPTTSDDADGCAASPSTIGITPSPGRHRRPSSSSQGPSPGRGLAMRVAGLLWHGMRGVHAPPLPSPPPPLPLHGSAPDPAHAPPPMMVVVGSGTMDPETKQARHHGRLGVTPPPSAPSHHASFWADEPDAMWPRRASPAAMGLSAGQATDTDGTDAVNANGTMRLTMATMLTPPRTSATTTPVAIALSSLSSTVAATAVAASRDATPSAPTVSGPTSTASKTRDEVRASAETISSNEPSTTNAYRRTVLA